MPISSLLKVFRTRFSIRAMMISILFFAVILGLIIVQAKEQRALVQDLKSVGAVLLYEDEYCNGKYAQKKLNNRNLFFHLLPNNIFNKITYVSVPRSEDTYFNGYKDIVSRVCTLTNLEFLELEGNINLKTNDLRKLPNSKNLRKISLSGVGLDGSVLKLLGKTSNLEEIQIRDFDVFNTDLASLGNLKNLKSLCFQGNTMDEIGFPCLSKLEKLQNLKIISIVKMRLTSDGIDALRDLKSLTTLEISSSNIRTLKSIEGLRCLDSIILESCPVDDQGLYCLKGLPNLELLSFNDCKNVTDKTLAVIEDLKRIKFLYLSGTSITNVGLNHVKSFKLLEKIDISGIKFSEKESFVVDLTNLELLSDIIMSDSTIDDIAFKNIRFPKNLKILDLKNTNLTHESLPYLKSLNGCVLLNLSGTKLSMIDLTNLRSSLPNTEIVFGQ